jgi:hypothetical protein
MKNTKHQMKRSSSTPMLSTHTRTIIKAKSFADVANVANGAMNAIQMVNVTQNDILDGTMCLINRDFPEDIVTTGACLANSPDPDLAPQPKQFDPPQRIIELFLRIRKHRKKIADVCQ